MTRIDAQVSPSTETREAVLWPHAFATDYAIAHSFGAGDQLQSLYYILQAVQLAQQMMQADPERVPGLLAAINEQATRSYRELMCTVGWFASTPPDAAM